MAHRAATDPSPAHRTAPPAGGSTWDGEPAVSADRAAPAPGTISDGVDPLSYAVFQALTRVLRSHARLMMRTLGEEGMHPGQAFCLRTLARHDGMSQRDLAATLHVSRPTVTAMLQRMERSGMVRRTVDESDQRISRVHLTDEGRRLERSLGSALLSYSTRVLDSIPAGDRLELERLLGRLADNMSAALGGCAPEARDDDGGREADR